MRSDYMSATGRVAMTTLFFGEIVSLAYDMRWLLLLCAVLLLTDLWWGICRALKHKHEKEQRGETLTPDEQVRPSRAIRRTLVKTVDYMCVVVLGSVLGQAIGEPLGVSHVSVAVFCVLLSITCELDSIYSNYCECKGICKRLSIRKLLVAFLPDQFKKAIKESEVNDE